MWDRAHVIILATAIAIFIGALIFAASAVWFAAILVLGVD